MESLDELTLTYRQATRGVIDYEKYNLYAISHHSTVIEGSTLTEIETQVFLDEGLTAKGKPISDHFMVTDHLEALKFVMQKAQHHSPVSIELIRQIASIVLKNTGIVYNTALGSFDSGKGDFRLLNVSAGIGGKSYLNYSKVPEAMKNICKDFSTQLLNKNLTTSEVNDLAFLLHYQFVTIHPFADGNGRGGRLLMNFVQSYFDKPMTVLFSQNKAEYIQALVDTREQENVNIFLNFMRLQHHQYLKNEIARLQPDQTIRKNFGGIVLFF
jgi:Fic family protein